jgi:hypothetical protein
MNWFKMHTDARNDAKLRTLTDAQHRTWFRMICYAAELENGGVIGPSPINVVAIEVSEGSIPLLEETCNALQALQCISWVKAPLEECNALQNVKRVTGVTGVTVVFLAFGKRQHSKPSDDPKRILDRVNRYRAKAKQQKQLTSNAEGKCNASNAPVTPVTRYVTTTEQSIDDDDDELKKELIVSSNHHQSGDVTPVTRYTGEPITDIPATIDTLVEEVEQVFPGTQFPGLVYDLCKIYRPTSVEWGFRESIAMAWKGERMTVKRITGLVNYAQENKLIPSDAMRTPTQDPRAKVYAKPKSEKQIWREGVAEKLKKLNEQLGDDEGDDDE